MRSMTGFGAAKGTSGKLEISVELRSVNNRYLDCSVRIPRLYNFAEDAVKSSVQDAVARGKVDVTVAVDSSKANDVVISVNEPLVDAYVGVLNLLERKYGLKNDMGASALCGFPDVLLVEKQKTDSDAFTADLCAVLKSALDDYNAMREREGASLREDILKRLDAIETLVAKAEERSPKAMEDYRQRLEQRMKDVLDSLQLDEARILTEAAIFADRITVSEETVRLRSHIGQLREMLESVQPVGRKADFLIQEFNREANTIGSKCNDTEMSGVVIDLKAEIEKIREQVQNIE